MRKVIDLSGTWAFSMEADRVPEQIPVNWLRVNVPHTWNNADGMDGGGDFYRGTCYYAREIRKSDLPEADQYYLEFEGTNSSADLYVNGIKLGHHDGGYSAWRVDITDALQETNWIVVAVDNSPNDFVYPQRADFTFYGGMYRAVRLLAVEHSHFNLDYYGCQGVQISYNLTEEMIRKESKASPSLFASDVLLQLKTWISNAQAGQTLEFSILDADRCEVLKEKMVLTEDIFSGTDSVYVTMDMLLPEAHLWNGRKDPYLYEARVCLLDSVKTAQQKDVSAAEQDGTQKADSRGKCLDEVRLSLGFRCFRMDAEKGFFLNGEHTLLRGVARHQDRLGKGNALSREDHEQDMDLICELGANTIRLAHYQHDPYFYDLCDRRGMIVWAEIPYISSHMPKGRQNTLDQMHELLTQNVHHAAIAFWGLSNEVTMGGVTEDMMENHHLLNGLVHRMIPNALTVSAYLGACDECEKITYLPDALAYNLYYGWYEGDASETGPRLDRIHAVHPNQALGLSEYGADCLEWHSVNPRRGDYTEEYQALYHEKLICQIIERPYLFATYVWNMFDFGADNRSEGGGVGLNRKGLVTCDRKYKKDSFYAYKAWLRAEPFVHIAGKKRVDREEELTEVKVYSNQPSVELFVNGESVGINNREKMFFHFTIPNKGVSRLEAVAGTDSGIRDKAVIRKVNEPNPDYIMKDPGIVLNWFDLTECPGYFSLNTNVDVIQKNPQADRILRELAGEAYSIVEKEDGPLSFLRLGPALRYINMTQAGSFGVKLEVTKEDLIKANNKLNEIPL